MLLAALGMRGQATLDTSPILKILKSASEDLKSKLDTGHAQHLQQQRSQRPLRDARSSRAADLRERFQKL
ncbi:hypothetical protein E4631_09070 [Hymenobacter sp. UV11]|uniref:hypothetical protein n=1 Tax=Hymenobacter sp. UV11 TaxID=1849735 RepID=UPI00105C81F8|nr:hypothetical protein [Hymenobacter sp. UV11]TDN39785.1 hypothetical protein A8B98_17610 [Hymenobacter sp. UV11]TFZ67092.1 hypothetical protein E4631_09070 [Hymenobacter sp. UV11]